MQDQGKTKKQLIDELKEMRLKVAEFQSSGATQTDISKRNQTEDALKIQSKNIVPLWMEQIKRFRRPGWKDSLC